MESLKPAKQEEAAPAGSDIAALIADEVILTAWALTPHIKHAPTLCMFK